MNTSRKLAAILAADVAGYSRLTGLDEEGTHVQLHNHLRSSDDNAVRAQNADQQRHWSPNKHAVDLEIGVFLVNRPDQCRETHR